MKVCLQKRIVEALFAYRDLDLSASFLTKRVNKGVNHRPNLKSYYRLSVYQVSNFLKYLVNTHVVYRVRCTRKKPILYRLFNTWQCEADVYRWLGIDHQRNFA